MTHIYAMANQKGGVGKTTNCFNLAAALAANGKRVLLVDCDPQSSLTAALGVSVLELERSLYDLLFNEGLHLGDVVLSTKIGGVDLIPSHPKLAEADLQLLTVLEPQKRLAYQISVVSASDYHFVLIDCLPSLGTLMVNALVAADEVLVPYLPTPLSTAALPYLFSTMDRLYRLNPKLRVFGIIPSIVDTRTKVPRVEMDRLRCLYPRLRILPSINKGVALERAMGLRISILDYMPHSTQAAAYRELARILIEAAPGPNRARTGSPGRNGICQEERRASTVISRPPSRMS